MQRWRQKDYGSSPDDVLPLCNSPILLFVPPEIFLICSNPPVCPVYPLASIKPSFSLTSLSSCSCGNGIALCRGAIARLSSLCARRASQTLHLLDFCSDCLCFMGRCIQDIEVELHDSDHEFEIFVNVFHRLRALDVVDMVT